MSSVEPAPAPGADRLDGAAAGALVDRIAAAYAEPPHDAEIEQARAEHDGARGRIFDDDELYAQHMASFLEWYVLERPLRGSGRVPAVDAAARGLVDRDAPEGELLAALAGSQRGLLEVQRVRSDAVVVNDLIRGGRWLLDWASGAGVAPDDLFEGRLVPWRGRVCLGPVLVFHPRVARASILELLAGWAERGELGPDVIARLAEMRLRFSRFRNIAVEHIYKLAHAP